MKLHLIVSGNENNASHQSGLVHSFSVPADYIWAGITIAENAYIYEDCGMRFVDVNIPKGAIIVSAILKLAPFPTAFVEPPQNQQDWVRTRFYGEATDNAQPFSTHEDYDARVRTKAYVDWMNIEHWTWDGLPKVSSPNLAPIIQEIVNRPGWRPGNALVIFWCDNGSTPANPEWYVIDRCCYPYNRDGAGYDPQLAPELEIVYQTPGRLEPIDPRIDERYIHDNFWESGEVTINAADEAGQQNLGTPVPRGKRRRIKEITIRHTGTNNTVVTILVAGGGKKLSIDVPPQSTRVWSSGQGRIFEAGEQPAVQSSDVTGGNTYVSATGVEE